MASAAPAGGRAAQDRTMTPKEKSRRRTGGFFVLL
jgi:hypothetical protein